MNWRMPTLGLIAIACLAGALVAADKEPAEGKRAGATVEVLGLHVSKPLPEAVREQFDRHAGLERRVPPATRVTLLVTVPDHVLIGVNAGDLRVARFTDDRHADLSAGRAMNLRPRDAFPNDNPIGPGGHHVCLEVGFTPAPTPGAKSVKFVGSLKLSTGLDEKTVDAKAFPLRVGGEIKAGAATLTVKSVGESGKDKMVIAFALGGDAKTIGDVTFLTKDGDLIPATARPREAIADRLPELLFFIPQGTEEPTVRVRYFDKVEAITVPIEFEAGVGL